MPQQLSFDIVNSVWDELQNTLEAMLEHIYGKDIWDDSAKETARRVLKYWLEYAPMGKDDLDFDFTTFEAVANQLIVCKDIEFSSICVHHLLPFYGRIHVGYIPNELMVGISKIPRLVDWHAKRPQVQEKLTAAIAHDLKDRLQAQGVAVVCEARHTCMACRGVRKHNGVMITSEMRGVFMSAEAARIEFLNLIGRNGI